ncbi:superoxide dismutase [Ophiocordyceps camponoti-floridani]|uniref:superoxide dismutase n=1 Tax=Ophiocordyceps camponoti-floridani TaxID=2030778 RepID=A0A8H4QC37_9HYPO|nr:superoxide dismutase [Ophiocordyceps camponoti-floridani]
MRVALLATASLSAGLVAAQGTQPAPVIKANPSGASFEATLPAQAFTAGSLDGNVKGSIVASTPADGVGVEFKIQFENVPQEGGPFLYHVHEQPVPADGNCTKTLAHLDPYKRGEDPPCDSTRPETCQVGDLSGKHGKPNSTSTTFTATYVDRFLSTSPQSNAFLGNVSFVFHFANKTRITCANFQSIGVSAAVGPSTGGGQSSAASTATVTASASAGTGSSSSPSSSAVAFSGDAAISTLSMSLTMLSVAAAFAWVF